MSAQRIALGIAPAYDAGGDDFGPLLVQHLTLYIYQDLLGSKQFAPSLLSPGGVYTPLDTSWLTEYVQDRPELDLLLVATLKPTVSDKASSTIAIELDLLTPTPAIPRTHGPSPTSPTKARVSGSPRVRRPLPPRSTVAPTSTAA